jgi:hypothetical protein
VKSRISGKTRYSHFRVTFPLGFEGVFVFRSEIIAPWAGIVRLIVNEDNNWKLGLPRWMVGIQGKNEEVTVDLGPPIPTEIYLSVFADVSREIVYTITWGARESCGCPQSCSPQDVCSSSVSPS